MKKEDFINALTEIGTCEDEAERRTLLTNLQEEAVKDYDSIAALTSENEKYKEDNEKLRSANMDLFLRVGSKTQEQKEKEEGAGAEGSGSSENNLTYDNLFDEKGDLK